jgi:hypothetical protein
MSDRGYRLGSDLGPLELCPEDVCDSEYGEAVAGPYRSAEDARRDAVLARWIQRVGRWMTAAMIATCGYAAGYVVGYVDGVPAGLLMTVAHWTNAR